MKKPIPDTRVACGIQDCAELREPWTFACDAHMKSLPPGVRRLINTDSSQMQKGNMRDVAWKLARRHWAGETIEDIAPPIVLGPMTLPPTPPPIEKFTKAPEIDAD